VELAQGIDAPDRVRATVKGIDALNVYLPWPAAGHRLAAQPVIESVLKLDLRTSSVVNGTRR
jgi:hypothetical protein